jgi:hypothetical protein
VYGGSNPPSTSTCERLLDYQGVFFAFMADFMAFMAMDITQIISSHQSQFRHFLSAGWIWAVEEQVGQLSWNEE